MKNNIENFKGFTPLVLVFTHDYFTLFAALVKRNTGEIISQSSSVNLDLDKALEEVLQDLRGSGYRLPKRGFMAVNYAVSGLFDLPVDPKKPRPNKQMQELVRYELDTHLSEFKDLWSIQAITHGRGYINEEQRTSALQRLNEKRNSSNASLVRFTDIAVEEGFINVHQRDEVLDLQNEITVDNETLECGWQSQVLAQQDSQDLQFWYGTGIDRVKRNAWARRFRHEGIKLVKFFPITELGILLASDEVEELQAILIFSIGTEQVHCYRVEKDEWNQAQITAITSEQTEGHLEIGILSEIGLSLLTESVEKIYIQSESCDKGNDLSQSSLKQLSIKFDKPTVLLTDSYNKPISSLGLLAQLAGQYKNNNCIVSIDAEDPGPPFWKDINFLRYAIPALIIALILFSEIYTRYSIWSLDKELIELKQVTTKQSEINDQMSAVMSIKNNTEIEISTLEQELSQLQSEIEAGVLFQSRTMLAHDVLKVIEDSVNVEIMLNSITEPPRSKNPGFHLKAWAVSEPAAVRFISKLKRNLHDVSYKVVNELNQADKNRYGMSGQSIDMWLIPDATKTTKSKGI